MAEKERIKKNKRVPTIGFFFLISYISLVAKVNLLLYLIYFLRKVIS
jgi:hypothetical protein